MPTYFEVMNKIYMPHILRRIKEREELKMTETKRSKHISYGAQREQCRLNKYTYIEKINGIPVLFCNYPFTNATHKKGLCKASTCTDMREIPADVVAADQSSKNTPETVEPTAGENSIETEMPCPTNE